MIKTCKWCKKKFDTQKVNRKYCSEECAKQGKLKYQREYEAKKAAEKKKPRKKKSDLADSARTARAAGMSYGIYVSQNEGKIERRSK